MIKEKILHNNKAQVLGLPMYMIIVMIVAVAVIAAVLFMIPQGTKTMNALVSENAVIAEDPGNSSAFTFSSSYDITIQVTSNDNRADPVSGATVSLIGSGIASSGTTNGEGIATISVTPELGENINEASIKLIVKAQGFEDYSDINAVTVHRL
ncbi:MAG: hypothetical protein DRN27_04815 [Thermoplasmata archaeon]|nr:MAG: hypothetical protein DRN27_04815 [Thermoplasmata archaeon]